jgi:hypothetical protein
MVSIRTSNASQGVGTMDERYTSSKKMIMTGNIISGLVVLFLLVDGLMKALKFDVSVDGTVEFGYPEHTVMWIGMTLLVCTILYAIPRTAILGAILVTAYLGGATTTIVRMDDMNFYFPIVFGVIVWAGLYLRDGRLRALLGK